MALHKLIALLKEKPPARMRVPALWNTAGTECEDVGGGEILVDGARFFGAAIERVLELGAELAGGGISSDGIAASAIAFDNIASRAIASFGISSNGITCGDILRGDAIYALLPRHFTAWDHGDGLVGGSFLKAIALLPHIARFGVEIVYLLPIFTPSDLYKKGTLGSPYAIKDFYSLDPALHDPLLGAYSENLLCLQFTAFVEACHLLGLKVMVDFVFRTCARDNVFLGEHPDWFYWIDANGQDTFAPPSVPDLPGNTLITPETAKSLYAAKETPDYIARFRRNPRDIDPIKFEKCGGDLTKIERAFGLTTAPAFSDVLNDHQPKWTDVTYLRMDFGMNENAANAKSYANFANYEVPPFVLHDTIKLDIFPPKIPNTALFAAMENLIPHYIKKFGIDGARIDMGHALPKTLLRSMISHIRAAKPDFILWSEVFDINRSAAETAMGFDFVTGDACFALQKLLYGNPTPGLLPLLSGGKCVAAPEMPDTPRAALMYDVELQDEELYDEKLHDMSLHDVQAHKVNNTQNIEFTPPKHPTKAWKTAVALSTSLPNARPFFCAGLELGETQPMNLGLGQSRYGRHALPKSDPDHAKLAFFDACRLHWCSACAVERMDFIGLCMRGRGNGGRAF